MVQILSVNKDYRAQEKKNTRPGIGLIAVSSGRGESTYIVCERTEGVNSFPIDAKSCFV
jgi:hypothetical protein